jgi:predicted HAD superfamily Cof-like phosphohydrolase
MDKMNLMLDAVKEFQRAFDQPVNISPTLGDEAGGQCYKRAQLRYDLGKEELREYYEAVVKGDIVGVFDSLVDQLYVLIGTAHEHGMAEALCDGLLEVHQSNMTKLGEKGEVLLHANGKIKKSENYIPPDLDKVLKGFYSK